MSVRFACQALGRRVLLCLPATLDAAEFGKLAAPALLGVVCALALCVGHAGALDANAVTCFGRVYDLAHLAKTPTNSSRR
jgi:hypothetical protein